MRINIRISLEFFFIPARNFKKMRILKLMRFILVRILVIRIGLRLFCRIM